MYSELGQVNRSPPGADMESSRPAGFRGNGKDWDSTPYAGFKPSSINNHINYTAWAIMVMCKLLQQVTRFYMYLPGLVVIYFPVHFMAEEQPYL